MSIIAFKGGQITDGQPVAVYLNLNKSEGVVGAIDKPWYSLRCQKTGQVLAHADELVLDGAKFTVNAAGREKVRQAGRKNVHAHVVGRLRLGAAPDMHAGDPIFYDPYLVDEFVVAGTSGVVRDLSCLILSG
jgi:hypothetical protein